MKTLILSLIFCAASLAQTSDVSICQLDSKDNVILDASGNRQCFALAGPVVDSLNAMAASMASSYNPYNINDRTTLNYADWFDMVSRVLQDVLIRQALERFPTPELKTAQIAADKAQTDLQAARTAELDKAKLKKPLKVQ